MDDNFWKIAGELHEIKLLLARFLEIKEYEHKRDKEIDDKNLGKLVDEPIAKLDTDWKIDPNQSGEDDYRPQRSSCRTVTKCVKPSHNHYSSPEDGYTESIQRDQLEPAGEHIDHS